MRSLFLPSRTTEVPEMPSDSQWNLTCWIKVLPSVQMDSVIPETIRRITLREAADVGIFVLNTLPGYSAQTESWKLPSLGQTVLLFFDVLENLSNNETYEIQSVNKQTKSGKTRGNEERKRVSDGFDRDRSFPLDSHLFASVQEADGPGKDGRGGPLGPTWASTGKVVCRITSSADSFLGWETTLTGFVPWT